MAMNKKEQKEFEDARQEVFIARALNWSEQVLPDVPRPEKGETHGFVFNMHTRSVLYGLSRFISHAISRDGFPEKTASQGGIAMYSTRLLALKALRSQMERNFAEQLAKVDIQIQYEKAIQK